MSTTVIDELVTILGVDIKSGTQPTVEKFSSFLGGVMKNAEFSSIALIGFAGAMAGAVAAVFDFTMHQAKTTGDMQKTHDIFGINTKDLQQMRYAAVAAGADADNLQKSLEQLVQTESSPMPENFNHTLVRMGISVQDANRHLKDAKTMFMDITDYMKHPRSLTGDLVTSPTDIANAQTGWLNALRIPLDQLRLMKQTRAEIEANMAKAPVRSEEEIARADKFNRSLGELVLKLDDLKARVGVKLLPFNEELVKDLPESFEKFWNKIVKVNDALVKLRGPFDDILPQMKNADLIVNSLAVGMGALALATVAATWKWVLLAGAVWLAIKTFQEYEKLQKAKPPTEDEANAEQRKTNAEWKRKHPHKTQAEIDAEDAAWAKKHPHAKRGPDTSKEIKDFITSSNIFKTIFPGPQNTEEWIAKWEKDHPLKKQTETKSPVLLNKKEEEALDKINPMTFFSKLLDKEKESLNQDKTQSQRKGDYFHGYGLDNQETPTITVPGAPVAPGPISLNTPQQRGGGTQIHIEQHIQGSDARLIADESARKIQSLLQTISPGGYVEVFS